MNKLVDQFTNLIIILLTKKLLMVVILSWLKKTQTNSKVPKFKVNDKVRITKYENIFSKGYTENWSREIFIIDSILETNPRTFKIRDLNREKIIESFYVKIVVEYIINELLSRTRHSY